MKHQYVFISHDNQGRGATFVNGPYTTKREAQANRTGLARLRCPVGGIAKVPMPPKGKR